MQRTISPITLAYSILVGPILWFAHFIFVYALSEFGCRANFSNWWYFPPETIRGSIILATIPMLLLVAIGAFLGYSSLNRLNRVQTGAEESDYFLAASGVLLSGLFLFIILMTTVPSFVLSVCDKAI